MTTAVGIGIGIPIVIGFQPSTIPIPMCAAKNAQTALRVSGNRLRTIDKFKYILMV